MAADDLLPTTDTGTNVTSTVSDDGATSSTTVESSANLGTIPDPDLGDVTPSYEAPEAPDFGSDSDSAQINQYVDPTTGTVTDPSLVANQMTGLLSQASPLLDQSKADALKIANSRGLLNSSIAAGAGVDAMMRNMLPIAQQDAKTHETQNLTNQKSSQQLASITHQGDVNAQLSEEQSQDKADLMGYEATLGEYKAEADQHRELETAHYKTKLERLLNQDSHAFQLELNALDYTNQTQLMALEETLKEQLAAVQQTYAVELENLKSKYDIQGNLDTVTGALYGDMLKSLASFLNSPDLSAEQQEAGANNIIENLAIGLEFLTNLTIEPELYENEATA